MSDKSASESSDSDVEFELSETDESADDESNELIEGDFVVICVKGENRGLNYIARIDVADDEGFEGVFLKKLSKKHMDQHVFVPNEDDEAMFTQDDVIKKLLPPKIAGRFYKKSLSAYVFQH